MPKMHAPVKDRQYKIWKKVSLKGNWCRVRMVKSLMREIMGIRTADTEQRGSSGNTEAKGFGSASVVHISVPHKLNEISQPTWHYPTPRFLLGFINRRRMEEK